MDLQTRKISFVQEFLKLQNEEIISALERILQKKKTELTEKKFTPMSMQELNDEIDQAMDDITHGRVIEVSELRKKYQQKWK